MSAFKKIVFIFTVLFVLIFAGTKADSSIKPELGVIVSDLLLGHELLKSKISELESQVNEKTQQLIIKDELINQKEKTGQKHLELISYSQSNLASLQGKGIVSVGEQVSKARAGGAELENAHGWLPDWLIAYLIRIQTFLQKNWSKHWNAAMKSVIKKILEKTTQAGKWVFETSIREMHWTQILVAAVNMMEGKSVNFIDLIEFLANNKLGLIQILYRYVNKKDDIPTFDPYSIEKCMDALEMIADLDDNGFFMALEKFKDADWRKMFIKMPSSRRKKWLESLG